MGSNILTGTPKAKTDQMIADSPTAGKTEVRSMVTPTQDIFVDAHGFTYKSIRFCDLDRICDK